MKSFHGLTCLNIVLFTIFSLIIMSYVSSFFNKKNENLICNDEISKFYKKISLQEVEKAFM